MSHLTFPTVHLNGTSKNELQKQVMDAYLSLEQSLKLMCEAAPHSRDYYVQSEYAYEAARTQHYNRLTKINELMSEYQEIFEKLDEQNGKYGK